MVVEAGSHLGHFSVLSRLGAGSMGEVWRARDERLARDVAIKVLPAEVASDPDRLARFEREAKALARLSHPNILAIHEFGHEGATAFAVTELLEGETLGERLGRGALPWRKAVDIAAAIAEGIAAAHDQGIVHRDLKPANVFLTSDGRVKVLDFGLARVEQASLLEEETLTSPPSGTERGTVLGTVGYMAPEQVRGEPADERSDVFAMGCVLYEMLTGRPPFRRATGVETMTAILKDEPPDVSISATAVTPELNRLMARCLEKSPGRRFQSASDLAFHLRSLTSTEPVRPAGVRSSRRLPLIAVAVAVVVAMVGALVALWSSWRGAAPAPALVARRVVVLPFENNSGDPSLAPLSRMASDWITEGLSRIEGLEVLSSRAVMFAERSGAEPAGARLADVAAATGAGLVVTGAYYRPGDALQLQATVTDTASGKIVAALEPVSGDPSSPMALIDAMRQRVLGAIAVNFGTVPQLAPLRRGEQRLPLYEAYREFILGFELFATDDEEALRHFERAREIDPTFRTPVLYEAYLLLQAGRREKMERLLADASEHRGELTPLGRRWLDGFTAYAFHRYAEARRHLVEIDRATPRDPLTVHWIGLLSLYTNEPRRAVDAYGQFPVQPWGSHVIGAYWVSIYCDALHMLGEHESELEAALAGVAAHPEWWPANEAEIAALAALGRVEEAVRRAEACAADPDTAPRAGHVLLTAAKELRAHGHRDAARPLAARAAAWYQARSQDPEATGASLRRAAEAWQYAERWQEAAAVMGRPGVSTEDDPYDMGTRGTLAARLGDRTTALETSEALRQLEGPYLFGRNTYRRACIAAVLGERDQAVALLREAFAEGVPYGAHIHTDIDLESLRDDPAFNELLRPKG